MAPGPNGRGADNVAFFRPDGGGRQNGPDRHQLPPSALTPAQFEIGHGTPAAADDDVSSRENLLAPRGQ